MPATGPFEPMEAVDNFLEQLDDCQKNELVGRALKQSNAEQWSSLLRATASERHGPRTVRCCDMSGRTVELKVKPFQTLFTVKQELLKLADEFLPRIDKKREVRQAKLYHAEVELPDHMLGSMLPEQISVVYKKDHKLVESDSDASFEFYCSDRDY
ncbi:unnamed protein product [Cladocopium goreaui]|uniref:Uncharacterized protein n=1 Tax=Cladocopium goreaui TaxID=2562237 RepID=A0A9P1C8J0_9DINO|nr:unnamed protein product [Cladocopium goreaui]